MRIKPIDFMAIMGRSKLIFIFMRCCSYGVRGNSTETMEAGGGVCLFYKRLHSASVSLTLHLQDQDYVAL